MARRSDLRDADPEHQAELIALMHRLERKYRERAEDAQSQLDQVEANARLGHALAGKTTLLYLRPGPDLRQRPAGVFLPGCGPAGHLGILHRMVHDGRAAGAPVGGAGLEDARRGPAFRRHDPKQRRRLAEPPGRQVRDGRLVRRGPGPAQRDADDRRRHARPAVHSGRRAPEPGLRARGDHAGLRTAVPGRPARAAEFTQATRPERVQTFNVLTYRYNLRRMDPFSVEIPSERVRDAAVVAYPGEPVQTLLPVEGQVAICQLALTDRQGTAISARRPGPSPSRPTASRPITRRSTRPSTPARGCGA